MNSPEPIPTSPLTRPLSILLVGSQMETGGAQRILLEQACWFTAHSYKVTVAFLYDKEGLMASWREQYPFPIIDLKSRKRDDGKVKNFFHLVGGVFRIIRLLHSQPFDCVETFTHHPNMLALPLAWLAGVKVRVATHHGIFHGFGSLFQHLHAVIVNSKAASCVVAVSQQVRRQAIIEGIRTEKIVVIPNGVDVPKIKPIDARVKIRSELKIGQDSPVVLVVGRLQVEKGHDLLLEAVPQVIKQIPETIFLLAGDGPLRGGLEVRSDQQGTSRQVNFLGFRRDIPELLAAADLMVMPSRTEGMPGALLEAMAMGLAVVAFDVGGIGEAAVNGVTALLVPPQDTVALAEAVVRLLSNENERRQLGHAALYRAVHEFTSEKMCKAYESLFGKIMLLL